MEDHEIFFLFFVLPFLTSLLGWMFFSRFIFSQPCSEWSDEEWSSTLTASVFWPVSLLLGVLCLLYFSATKEFKWGGG